MWCGYHHIDPFRNFIADNSKVFKNSEKRVMDTRKLTVGLPETLCKTVPCGGPRKHFALTSGNILRIPRKPLRVVIMRPMKTATIYLKKVKITLIELPLRKLYGFIRLLGETPVPGRESRKSNLMSEKRSNPLVFNQSCKWSCIKIILTLHKYFIALNTVFPSIIPIHRTVLLLWFHHSPIFFLISRKNQFIFLSNKENNVVNRSLWISSDE